MRSLLVIPLFLAMALAEEHFAPSHSKSNSHFNSHTQPVDQTALEEELVEEKRHHPIHQHEEVPHPHLVHQDQFHPKMPAEGFPKKFEKESGSHSPVPNPHLVQEAEFQTNADGNAFQEPFEDITYNAVEQPVYVEEEIPAGTESTLSEDFFEHHHPNTGLPDIEPTVGTESGVGMEVVQEPVVLPVTEGKNRGQDTVVHYSLPKELMPIHPGGGSRFEDLEKEKLDKKKMAQTKGTDEDTENGASHEAEGLYSSAAKLCLSSVIFTLSSSFRLIV